MVEVEQRSLSTFEQHTLFLPQRPVDEERRVGDQRSDAPSVLEQSGDDLVGVERLELVDTLEPHVLLGDRQADLLAQDLRIDEVLNADPDPRRFVRVGRADAASGGSDLQPPEPPLAGAVERDVPRHDEVCVPGDEDEAVRAEPARFELVDLRNQDSGVDDAARPDRADLAADDSRRDLPDLVRLLAHDDRVPGVGAALVAADEVGVPREQVDDLAFPLVAPLRADDHGRGHVTQFYTQLRRRQVGEFARRQLIWSDVCQVARLEGRVCGPFLSAGRAPGSSSTRVSRLICAGRDRMTGCAR